MLDIISIGSATRDGFFEGVPFTEIKSKSFKLGKGICLPFGDKVIVPKITFSTGGGAVNTATTFSRQGLKTATIIRVANDISGKELIAGLKKEKVDIKFVQTDFKTSTGYSVIFLTPSAERTILTYRGCSDNLTEKEIPWEKLKTKWVFIDPLGGNEKLLKKILSFCKNNKIKVASTPGKGELKILKQNPSWLNYYDVFILNQEEASELTDVSYISEKAIFKKLDKWVNGIVVMTKGRGGATVSDGHKLYQAGIFKEKNLIDRTGAGDAFASGFVSGLILKPNDLDYAVKLGSANGTAVVEHIGSLAGILKKGEINQSRWNKFPVKIINLN
ncbi:MAG: carbohydrate kinase family protein [Candidatus Parcubacteria bacterium]|nr:carbohydrate kinase family protein [Candidatus Parcubacteria bacterium]